MAKFEPGGPPRFAHQRKALNTMIRTGGVTALLMDPGTGKTAVAIDYACLLALKARSGEARVLVVAPLAAVDTWVMQVEQFASPQVSYWAEALGGTIRQRAEALADRGGQPFRETGGPARRKFTAPRGLHADRALFRVASVPQAWTPDDVPGPRVVLEVINIDTLTSRRQVGSRTMADVVLDGIKRFAPDLVVVDESHRIKGATANASRLLARVTPFVDRRVILTGTAMPHGPLDIFGQWRFLDPYAFGQRMADGSLKQATISGFKGRFAKMGGFMGKEVIGYRNLDEMQEIMARNAVVVRKKDALDLPPTTDVTVPVNLTTAELRAYSDMKGQLAHQLATGQLATVPNQITKIMRLRQITSGYLPDDTGALNQLGQSKARTIDSIVHDNLAGEQRIVIFGVFTAELRLLQQMLARKGTEVLLIDGSTSSDDRQLIRKRFGSDEPTRMVLVCQIKTMSLAVNELVTANHAIFASLSQQRDDLVQARDRLDRIGQTRPVTFWYAIAPKTIDEVILKAHQQRTDLEAAVLRHVQSRERGED